VRHRGSTFSGQSAHRWQPHAPAVHPLPPGRFLVLISVKRMSQPQGHSAAGRIMLVEKSGDLFENPTILERQLAGDCAEL
jgi:hypothetical protein